MAYALDARKDVTVSAIESVQVLDANIQSKSYYLVNLEKDNQDYLMQLCAEYGVPLKIVLALIEKESNFQPNVISKTNDYGLMQINIVNHKWLAAELGITNFLDVKQNLKAGVYMLSKVMRNGETIEQTIMRYGLGDFGAQRLFNQGICSTRYTRDLLRIAEGIEVIE